MAVTGLPGLAEHLPDTSLVSQDSGHLADQDHTSLESMATGQMQTCVFPSTSDPPLWPLLAVTTLATGTEGRLPSASRGQMPALNHVLLHFRRTAFHFCSCDHSASTFTQNSSRGEPYSRTGLPRLRDHT